jgi:8-amino-7-oxononanoate synthase
MKEIAALKRSGRYRERHLFDEKLIDLASNDYLGLAHNARLLDEAIAILSGYSSHAAKASMLVNGYHRVHAEFEAALCRANGFEAGVVLGSGFNANIALIETLVRKGDELFIDDKYHASGVLAAKLVEGKVTFFSHNDPDDLESKLKRSSAGRRIIAVEGIYSMDGDLLKREIISIADAHEALLIVDEAHSSGVIGPNLMGVLDHYGISPKENHIKMGTLGKAYGSFGAYILASKHIVDFLINRAKPIIYATAPSLFDTLLGHRALHHIEKNSRSLHAGIEKRRMIVKESFDVEMPGLILPVPVGDNRRVMHIQQLLLDEGILVGAIRQPTVERAIIRLIARLGVEPSVLRHTCEVIEKAL